MITVPMASWGAKSWASTLSDVFEGKEEKHDFSHLILDGHHVQEAPKGRACRCGKMEVEGEHPLVPLPPESPKVPGHGQRAWQRFRDGKNARDHVS